MTRQSKDRGRRAESAVARILGGKRRGVLGGEDVEHPLYSIEVKSRKQHAVFKWFRQCIKNNKENKIPLLIIHEHHQRHNNDLVCMTMKDFLELC